MYSDPVLAFKLLDKANMEEADIKQLFSCIGESFFFSVFYEEEVPYPSVERRIVCFHFFSGSFLAFPNQELGVRCGHFMEKKNQFTLKR
jgi:hypothetical protein